MITVKYTNDNEEEVELKLPSKMEVCSRCEGHGSILNPSIGEHAYTMEEFRESFDEEEREQYFKRGGIYDVQCPVCCGRNVVEVIDEDHIPEAQKVQYEAYCEYQNMQARFDAEERHEREMEY